MLGEWEGTNIEETHLNLGTEYWLTEAGRENTKATIFEFQTNMSELIDKLKVNYQKLLIAKKLVSSQYRDDENPKESPTITLDNIKDIGEYLVSYSGKGKVLYVRESIGDNHSISIYAKNAIGDIQLDANGNILVVQNNGQFYTKNIKGLKSGEKSENYAFKDSNFIFYSKENAMIFAYQYYNVISTDPKIGKEISFATYKTTLFDKGGNKITVWLNTPAIMSTNHKGDLSSLNPYLGFTNLVDIRKIDKNGLTYSHTHGSSNIFEGTNYGDIFYSSQDFASATKIGKELGLGTPGVILQYNDKGKKLVVRYAENAKPEIYMYDPLTKQISSYGRVFDFYSGQSLVSSIKVTGKKIEIKPNDQYKNWHVRKNIGIVMK
jgi:hypothetical protein